MLEKRTSFSGRRSFFNALSQKLFQDDSTPELEAGRASVAVVFSVGGGDNLLFIKRAVKDGDPWSGQIAFPGGRVEDGDSSFRDTATRETMEEVGIDLRRDSRFLGYLGPFEARTGDIMVVPSLFALTREPKVSPDVEVASYKWIPISSFRNPSTRSIYTREGNGTNIDFPSYVVGDYVIWGLTERIMSTLIGYLD